jgi:hypothetical protein
MTKENEEKFVSKREELSKWLKGYKSFKVLLGIVPLTIKGTDFIFFIQSAVYQLLVIVRETEVLLSSKCYKDEATVKTYPIEELTGELLHQHIVDRLIADGCDTGDTAKILVRTEG